ncbi:hypothetical protein ACWEU6_36440 [Streptosporangium sandarakinum]|uniref:hypothetical protein n=1 Tax=Streptosporangium sandarakinum TaxID=1260955 RepID=UPI0036B81203
MTTSAPAPTPPTTSASTPSSNAGGRPFAVPVPYAWWAERTERLMRDLEGLVDALEEDDRPAHHAVAALRRAGDGHTRP